MDDESAINRGIVGVAHSFGSLVRSRRKAMRMRQDQLALATGVGRRFVIDLEAGKPSCQLGRSLLVAKALGGVDIYRSHRTMAARVTTAR